MEKVRRTPASVKKLAEYFHMEDVYKIQCLNWVDRNRILYYNREKHHKG